MVAWNKYWPEELNDFAYQIGQDRNLTQGPGGNISLKSDGVLWIKASGTHLREARNSPIFVGLDLDEVRRDIEQGQEIFTNRYGDPGIALRASIETAMHAQIDHPYVAHVHSVGAVSVAVLKDHEDAINRAREYCNVAFVPYVKPGIRLANALDLAVTKDTAAALLGNHGLTVWGDSSEECMEKIVALEQIWCHGAAHAHENAYEDSPISKQNVWSEVLSSGILVPDEIVFLGSDPFEKIRSGASAFEILSESARARVSKSNWLGDFVTVLESVARNISRPEDVRFLLNGEIAELLNWDAEKYRQEMK